MLRRDRADSERVRSHAVPSRVSVGTTRTRHKGSRCDKNRVERKDHHESVRKNANASHRERGKMERSGVRIGIAAGIEAVVLIAVTVSACA